MDLSKLLDPLRILKAMALRRLGEWWPGASGIPIEDDSGSRAEQMARLYRNARGRKPDQGLILFWSPGGMPLMLHVEGAVAAALRLRGVASHAVVCDGPYHACYQRRLVTDETPADRPKACDECTQKHTAVLDEMGIPYSFVGDYVPESVRSTLRKQADAVTWENLGDLAHEGVTIGEEVRAAVWRYMEGHELRGQEEIVREYSYSALVATEAAARAMDVLKPARMFLSHGFFIEWGTARRVAQKRGIPTGMWHQAYLRWHFYFRHFETEGRPRIGKAWISPEEWRRAKAAVLSPSQNDRLDRLLDKRYERSTGSGPEEIPIAERSLDKFRRDYELDADRPVWGVLAHVRWDSVFFAAPMAYDTPDDWIVDTIRTAIGVPSVQWLIKAHPAEQRVAEGCGVQEFIESRFPHLPDHVKIVPSDAQITPMDFYSLLDGGITVFGTPGLELPLLGKPVIVAGQAHYGGKGFTLDGCTPESYRQCLRSTPEITALEKDQVSLARRYAYCYFVRRQIPLPIVHDPKMPRWWRFRYEERFRLLPGKDPFIDFICERLLDGNEFIMDDRLVKLAEKAF